MREKRYKEAYQHFTVADRLESTMLTSFRQMQCYARFHEEDDPKAEKQKMAKLYAKALGHANSSRDSDGDRTRFVEWIKDLKRNMFRPDSLNILANAMMNETEWFYDN